MGATLLQTVVEMFDASGAFSDIAQAQGLWVGEVPAEVPGLPFVALVHHDEVPDNWTSEAAWSEKGGFEFHAFGLADNGTGLLTAEKIASDIMGVFDPTNPPTGYGDSGFVRPAIYPTVPGRIVTNAWVERLGYTAKLAEFRDANNNPVYEVIVPYQSMVEIAHLLIGLKDTFTDVNGLDLTAHKLNIPAALGWSPGGVNVPGMFAIQGGKCQYLLKVGGFAVVNSTFHDQMVQGTVNFAGASGDDLALLVRTTATGLGGWWVGLDQVAGIFTIRENVSGYPVRASMAYTWSATGDNVVRMTAQGSALTATVNGTALLTWTDTSYASNTYVGIAAALVNKNGTGQETFDDFYAHQAA